MKTPPKKLKDFQPTPEEIDDGQGYSSAEWQTIFTARRVLHESERTLAELKQRWRKLIAQDAPAGKRVHRVVSEVSELRHLIRFQRRIVKEADAMYWNACIPDRLLHYRMGKLMADSLRERLRQESLADKILKPGP